MESWEFGLLMAAVLLLFVFLLFGDNRHEHMSDIYQSDSRGVTASSATAEYGRSQKLGGRFPSLGFNL